MASAPKESPSQSPFRVVILDDRQAVWMPINNSFAKSLLHGDPRTRIEHGILIQIGKSIRWPDEFKMDKVGSVALAGTGGVVETIGKAELENPDSTWWINVSQESNRPAAPMKPENLADLRVSPPRSLHKYFIPYPGGITLWPEQQLNISMRLTENDSEGRHVEYTFGFTGEIPTVDVYRNGEKDRRRSGGHYNEIRITLNELKPPPGQTWNPPQYP